MNGNQFLRAMVCVLLPVFAAVSCRPDESESEAATSSAAARERGRQDSPAAVARRLNACFAIRDYAGIVPLIVEEHRVVTIEMLRSVSKVLEADASLRQTAEEYYGVPYYATWSLASMADNLGVFSSQITLINQKHRGTEATVTLQEADYVPLVHARFELRGDRWLYRPDPVPPSLPSDLRGLASALAEIEQEVRSGSPFEQYAQAFFDKAVPKIRQVVVAGTRWESMAAGATAE